MSVYRCDYIVYGYKIPWTREESSALKEDDSASWKYADGGVADYHLIIDDMGGQYMVFGYVMYSNDFYADQADEAFMDFDEVKTNYRKKDLDHHYLKVFGKAPEMEAKSFAFSHIY
jgi:hypothetical protein